MTSARHMAKSGDRGTPQWLIEAGRSVLGAIDFDPASSARHNERVQAEQFYGADDESLESPWWGRVLHNAPGSCPRLANGRLSVCGNKDVCSCRLVPKFWCKLVASVLAGEVAAAIWIGFSVEQFQTLQSAPLSPLDFPTCVLKRRVKYLAPDGTVMKRPPHASYVTLVAPVGLQDLLFTRVFSEHGLVIPGAGARR